MAYDIDGFKFYDRPDRMWESAEHGEEGVLNVLRRFKENDWKNNPNEVVKALHSNAVKKGVEHLERFNRMLFLLSRIIKGELTGSNTESLEKKLDTMGYGGREWKILQNLMKATYTYVKLNIDHPTMKNLSRTIYPEIEKIYRNNNEEISVLKGRKEFDEDELQSLMERTNELDELLKRFYMIEIREDKKRDSR
jgi:heterodisulfide reductase subunit C